MSVTKFNKEEFLSLVINKLATEDGLKEIFYQKMLLGLHDNDPIYKTDTIEHTEGGVTVPSDVLRNVLDNIDWEMFISTVYGEDEFFNGPEGLYTSLCNALKEVFEAQGNDYKKMDLVGGDNSWWSNSYWNESVAKLMQILAQRIDPNNIKTYEQSGLLIELVEPPKNDGMIDVDHLRGSISPERGTYKGTIAELRIIDIMDADAGYSFAGENDTYWFGRYFDKVTYSYRRNAQSEPQSVTYEKILYKQDALETLAAIENGYEVDVNDLTRLVYTDVETSLGSYIYSGERVSEHVPTLPLEGTVQVTMKTEGEKHTFKVVKNPWVIPWYNIDGETYRRVRGADKKLSALTDPSKLDFTRLGKDQLESDDFLDEKAREIYDELSSYGEERRKAKMLRFSDGTWADYETDTKWGNIDMDNRQILEMEDGSIKTVYAETCAFELNDYLPSPLLTGYEDLVDKYISFCYSHLELTDGIRPVEYDQTECESYLAGLLRTVMATEPAANRICDLILRADKEDKNLIAMVEIVEDVDNCKSVELGSMLHYIGKYGSVLVNEPYFEKLANRYGFTLSQITYHFYYELFKGAYIEHTNRWIRLIMPQYKRRVEVEDLNRNFWVIGQVLAGICIDIFDPNGPIGAMIKGLLNEIAQLWENVAFLWAALAILSQELFYSETHSEVVMLGMRDLYPFLKYDDIQELTLSTSSLPLVENSLNYLVSMYPEYNLCILPAIRLDNFEKNYYSKIWYPGIWFYNRNEKAWTYHIFDNEGYGTPESTDLGIILNLSDYSQHIYGIKENEDTYSYVTPLSTAAQSSTEQISRFYGIARDLIDLNGNLYTYDNSAQEYVLDKQATVEINYYDVGEKLITPDVEQSPIFSFSASYDADNDLMETTNLTSVLEEDPLDAAGPIDVTMSKGFYQGELLSSYAVTSLLNYQVEVIYVELMPEYKLTHQDDNLYNNILGDPHTYRSAKAMNADIVLQNYFNTYIKPNRVPNKIYMLVGHFYYSSAENGSRTLGDNEYYYYMNNGELTRSREITINGGTETWQGASNGIDTGLVLFMPGSDHPYKYSSASKGMWAYSDYITDGTFGGNSAYKIDLYLKLGESAIQTDNWLIKYITMASVAASSTSSDAQARYEDSSNKTIFKHNWSEKYTPHSGGSLYNINERIFVYDISIDSNNTEQVNCVKIERKDMSAASLTGKFILTGTVMGLQDYQAPIPQNVKIQNQGADKGYKRQVLDKNSYYDETRWPDYEHFPNNGYENPYDPGISEFDS